MTFAELKAACVAAGITPGRSAAECKRRLEARKPKRLYAHYGLLNATGLKGVLAGNTLIYQGDKRGWYDLRGWPLSPAFDTRLVRKPRHVGKGVLIGADGSWFATAGWAGATGPVNHHNGSTTE